MKHTLELEPHELAVVHSALRTEGEFWTNAIQRPPPMITERGIAFYQVCCDLALSLALRCEQLDPSLKEGE